MQRLLGLGIGTWVVLVLFATVLFQGVPVAQAIVPDEAVVAQGFDCADVTQIPQVECEALVTFYYATGGENWWYNEGWLVTNTPCEWYGITCDAGHVTGLDTDYDNGLVGSIPSELANLSQLRLLSIGGNLSGVIPPELGTLSQLETFELRHNDEVSIPPELGNLSNLKTLYIIASAIPTGPSERFTRYECDGYGWATIPPELGNLSNLQYMSITWSLCGTIPAELGNLSNLHVLDLSSNNLSGTIPPELGNLSNLTHLNLSWVDWACSFYYTPGPLSGPLPPELGNLANLKYLNLYCQSFTGPIPPELGNLSNLESLYMASTLLSGSIPPELGNLSALISLDLSYGHCSPGNFGPMNGPLPPELGNLTNLEYLDLQCQAFTGPIPMSFINLLELYGFYFSETDLCEPPDPAFQAWIDGVPDVYSTGIICEPTSQQLYLPLVMR